MAEQSRLIAGAMSGTSADGVDVAIVRIDGRGLAMRAELIQHHHHPYEPSLKQAIFSLRAQGQCTFAELARVGREISLAYAACVNETIALANLKASDLSAIAAHGQTIYHQPPETIQWLDPALLAFETGCRVISDFRRADCAAGGQGAPLVPFADFVLFQHPTRARVLLNIGGIANLTYLPPGESGGGIDHVLAFDTGPGNCISDWLCRIHHPDGPGYDVNGALAAAANAVHSNLIDGLLEHPYFKAKPPKSTDLPTMIEAWKASVEEATRRFELKPTLPVVLRAAAHATAATIWQAMSDFLPRMPDEIIVSGGGARNPVILAELQFWLDLNKVKARLFPLGELGIAVDAKEAVAFALLGAATLDHFPANIPSCTGAKRRVVLGAITPAS